MRKICIVGGSWVWAILCATIASAQTISLNFSENSGNQPFSGGQLIGPFPSDSANWNTTDTRAAGTLASGSKIDLIDETGANTGVEVTWDSSGTYWNNDGTGNDEQRLAIGYLDDGGSGVSMTFTNIPYSAYRVYGLLASDASDGGSPYPARDFNVNGVWAYGSDGTGTRSSHGNIENNFSEHGEFWTEGSDTVVGNYWTIETSGSDLTIDGQPGSAGQRGSITAVIIEELTPVAQQPVVDPSGSLFAGMTVTITVAANGSTPSYQWYKGASALTGETNAVLTFASAAVTDSGDYSVEVTSSIGTETSDTVTLTINPLGPPTFPQDPESLSRYLTGSATLSVVVHGPPPITLQWALDGTEIPGETSATLTLTDITAGDAGAYTVIASNAQGATTSAPGVLSIRTPAVGSYEEGVVAEGPLGYWRLNETNGAPAALEYMNGHDGTHSAGVIAGIPGPRPTEFDGMEAANNAAQYDGASAGTTSGKSLMSNLAQFTMMGFINPDTLDSTSGRIGFIGQNDVSEFGIHGDTDFAIWTPGSGTVGINKTNLPVNAWSHIACVGDGEEVHFYLNGIELVSGAHSPTNNYGDSTDPFNIGFAILDGTGNWFDGRFDEVALYDKALTRAEVNGIYNLSLGMVSPTIVFQPEDQTLVLGDLDVDITFTAQASGTQPLSYQWKFGGVDILGATSDTLVISNATPADVGTYTLAVSNTADTILSDPATLTLISGPVSPTAVTTLEPDNVSFTVTMPTNSTGYLYQWSDGVGVIPMATNATLELLGVAPADSGAYTVEVTLGPDRVTSDPASLTVLPLATETYTSIVTNELGLLASWRLGETNGATVAVDELGNWDGVILSDPTLELPGALLGDPNTSAAFPGTSKVEVEDGTGAAPFELLTPQFTVEFWALSSGGSGIRSPITMQDVDTGVRWGWTFYATTDNQWGFDSYDGTTGPWNSILGPTVVQGQWTHVVGTYDGFDMNFYVNGNLAGTVANAPYDPDVFVPLWIGAGGTEAGSQQAGSELWVGQVDEVSLYDRALTLTEVQDHYAASFGVATLPEITQDPQFTWARSGESVSMVAGARGLPPLVYQWQKDMADIPGANDPTLDFVAASAADGGAYRCLVTNPNGSVTSTEATLFIYSGFPLAEGVSVNFWDDRDGPPPQELASVDVAGFFPLANWNNAVVPGTHASGDGVQPLTPIDQAGAATTMDVRWSSALSWHAGVNPPTTPDEKLGWGYLDDNDTPATTLDANNDGGVAGDGVGVSVTVSNIPYSTYAVVLLLNSDSTGSWGSYDVNGVSQIGGVTMPFSTYGGWFEGQNALLYFTQGSTLRIRAASGAGSGVRGSMSGFQILDAFSEVAPASSITSFWIDPVGGTYSLSWDSLSGTVYQVESESDLENGPWGDEAGSTVTATNGTTTFSAPAAGDNNHYRVIENPSP